MSQGYYTNREPNALTNQYRLVNRSVVETRLSLFERPFERSVSAIQGFSLEVYRDRNYLCSLRIDDSGMGEDVPRSVREARLHNGDVIYQVNLGVQKLRVLGSLTTRDRFSPSYNAEVSLRINSPLAFLQIYFQNADPLAQMKSGIEEAFQRYARETEHDRIKEKDFEYAANKNRQGRRTGLWIVRTHATITWDAQRQQLLAIERQNEIERKKMETSYTIQSMQNMYRRQEKSLDAEFDLNESAKQQAFQRGQQLNTRISSELEEHIVSVFVMEFENGYKYAEILQRHPEMAGFIDTDRHIQKLINGRLQQHRLQGPSSSAAN